MGVGASFTFTTNQAGVDRLLHSETGPYGQWLTRLCNRVKTGAQERANVDTGLMRSSIEFSITTEGGHLVGIVAARTSYAIYVHEKYNPFLLLALQDVLRSV